MSTTATPSVSCVLIFLDGARFLDEAIRSVVGQRGVDDWELLLVDDGSTDESTAIARRWAQQDPERIRYLEHTGHVNRGMSASRNAGITAARGRVIGFLDCDDVWLPAALAHGLRIFATHRDVDVVIGGTWRWHGWTGDADDIALDHLMSLPDAPHHTLVEPPRLLAAMYARPGAWRIPAICSLLILRDALGRIGGLDADFRGLYEDQVLYTKLAVHLRSVVDPRPVALYRQHPGSACQVAIDAGEWQRTLPSAPEHRFLTWMRDYVGAADGAGPENIDIAERNLAHAARGGGLAPEVADTRRRRHLPDPVRRLARRVRRLVRPHDAPSSILRVWSEQFLAPATAGAARSVLVVAPAVEDDEPWVARPPVGCRDRVVTRPWGEVQDAAPAADYVVVPLRAATELSSAALVDALRDLLPASATAVVMVPGPALDAERPGATALAALVGMRLANHRVSVESFGNAASMAALTEGRPAFELGTLVDRHDPTVAVILGLTIAPLVNPSWMSRGVG